MLVLFHQHNQDSNKNLLQFIKIGSACLFNNDNSIAYSILKQKAREIESSEDYTVLVVSGAIELGKQLEKDSRNKSEMSAKELQGYASLGQIELMELYKSIFRKQVAQLLVTEKELKQEKYIRELIYHNLSKNRITLINYNDCVDFEEIRKDNDSLAAEVMLHCYGDILIILGNDYNGFRDSSGNLIERVYSIDSNLYDCCKGKSKQGTGGFATKLDAARMILEKNKTMIVSNINYHLEDILNGTAKRTLFKK